MQRVCWFGVVALVLIVVGGCRGGSNDSAADAVRRQLGYLDKRQYGRQWDELHPLQQAFVPRDLYVGCAQKILGSVGITDVKVTETYPEASLIPGTDQRAESTAVSVEYTVTNGITKQPQKTTSHEFRVDGRWRWAIADPEPYRQGKCPS